MKYPTIQPNQCIVLHCEVRTGIVTLADGSRYLNEIGEPWLVFDSFEEARKYCQKLVEENSEMECVVIDSNHQQQDRIVAGKYGKG